MERQMDAMEPVNGQVSFWLTQLGDLEPRAALPGDRTVDVCIVGAGYTGLWTAYYLKKAAPHLRIAILEQRIAGYGASGRNGGWVTNDITGGKGKYLRSHPRGEVERFQRAMNDTVDEVLRVARTEGIEIDAVKGGELNVALNEAQQSRLFAAARSEQAWASTDLVLLSAQETADRINIPGLTGGIWHPHCAKIQPAKLVRGLADAVEALGVEIYENTRVSQIEPHRAITGQGTVTADYIVRATEGFTAGIKGLRRSWLPMNSSIAVTEPLPTDVWAQIGWDGYETLGDFAHAYIYAQRTADNRIALGGRGIPYRWGSKTDVDGGTHPATIDLLRTTLGRLFPTTADAAIEHVWSGVLGVPRDWSATVGLDPATGLAWAGGYVGTGVSTTNLAGRTLVDLILGNETEITSLPWVNHRVRKWEPEPIRWLAVTALYRAYYLADRTESRGRRTTSPIATMADLVSGRGH